MEFTSASFLFFFLPIAVTLYFLIPGSLKNLYLLVASYIFYFLVDSSFFLLIVIFVLVNYILGRVVQECQDREVKFLRLVFISSILFNLVFLIAYKYIYFFTNNVQALFNPGYGMLGPETILLPAGISFVAFNNLSYLIDIYTKKTKATKNIIDGNLYSIFFPRVLAGPIEKYQHASSQLINHKVSLDQFWYGVTRFIRGLAKKVLIANTLSFPVSQIFNTPSDELTTSLVWFGIICYTLQIFFDFSGYTDMAIGIGNMFGFRFVENFNYPYISKSITDFWRRWHMSLTGWLREYVYIPLGGNREGANRTYLNIFIVFLIVGVWHGASWTFIIWGIWFAFFMILERWKLFGALQKLPSAFGHLYTLLVVAIGWVIFRSETLMYAGNYIQTMFSLKTSGKVVQVVDFINYPIIIAIILGVIFSIPIQDMLKKANLKNMTNNKVLSQDLGLAVKIIFLIVILLISIMFTVNSAYTPFIYSKF